MRAALAPFSFTAGGPPPVSAIGDSIIYALSSDETLTTTENLVTLDSDVYRDSATYSISGGEITVGATGTYLLCNHVAADSGGAGSNRTSGETKIKVNGSLVSGAYTDGFIRRNTSDDEFSACGFGIYELTSGDTVEMFKQRINVNGSDGRIVGATTTFNTGKTALHMVRLNEATDAIILEATVADDIDPVTTDTLVDVPWTTQTRIDTGSFTHTSGNATITLIDAGRYLVCYSDSYSRDVDNATRTSVYHRLQLDGTNIPGTHDVSYIRGSQSGESILRGHDSACTIFESTSANQVLKLVASTEGGTINKTRLTALARLCVYKLGSSPKSFRIESTSVQNIGSTTNVTMVYDSSAWTDTGFSLATNEVTCTDATRYLILHAIGTQDGVGTRVAPWTRPQLGGTDVPYIGGAGYSRSSGSMEIADQSLGGIIDVGASGTVRIAAQSRAASGTVNRTASAGAFCGLDLSTL